MNNKVDEHRLRVLNAAEPGTGAVMYVMAREQRVHHNWPLLYAKEQADARAVPLVVLFAVGPMFNNGTARHNEWMIGSLKEVEAGLKEKDIPFYVQTGDWVDTVTNFALQYDIGEVVFDQNPLEPVRSWRADAAEKLPVRVTEVDGRNSIPVWEASDKKEFAAHTFRPKVHKKLRAFLTDFPNLMSHTHEWQHDVPIIDWEAIRQYRTFAVESEVPTTFTPGEAAGYRRVRYFIDNVLDGYAEKRNDPNEDALSNLSPYLRWGNVSAQYVAKAVQTATEIPKEDREAFLEELIVRRELTDNYVYYTKDYDTLAGAHEWAQKTLNEHRDDEREYVYTTEEFEQAATHDELWNAMQRQMVIEGKMHGWCRMYWAKKILEWAKSPEEAIEIALTLNDRYELDGRDSNGVVGVMWSIAGVHDRAWTERPVYGKIRYMNFTGAKRKFDVEKYIERYSSQAELFND